MGMSEKNKITKNMSFKEVIEKHPETVKIFLKYGLHCIGCPIASLETIEQGALAHGVKVDELVRDLNKVMKVKK